MMTIDDRAGSGQLLPLMRARGVPCQIQRMSYGDIAFLGNGPDGIPVPVGVEVKSIRDVLACVVDGRFAGHQLPGLLQAYEQIWLLIEGVWRPDPKTGLLQVLARDQWRDATVGQRRFMYKDLLSWLFTLQTKTALHVTRCGNWSEATLWLSGLYGWWVNKEWEEHRAHLAMHLDGTYDRLHDRAILVRPSVLRLVAAQLPGIGYDKSGSLAERYRTVEALMAASEDDLAQVPGVGVVLAGRIWKALRSPG